MSRDELRESLDQKHWPTVNRWLKRGDGVAVYENRVLDSSTRGHRKYVSFGSEMAQLEVEQPPEELPQIGQQINWMYRLIGMYRGESL